MRRTPKVGDLVRGKGFRAKANLEWNGALAVVLRAPNKDGSDAEIKWLHDGRVLALHRSSLEHWFEYPEETQDANQPHGS